MHKAIKMLSEVDAYLSSTPARKSEYIKSWRGKGTYPRAAMPKLLEILNYYFSTGRDAGFSGDLSHYPRLPDLMSQFSEQIDAAHSDDALFFSSQSLSINDKKIYVLEVLKKLFNLDLSDLNGCNTKDVMMSLARCLSRYDPSYIIDAPVLSSMYSKDLVGPGFNFPVFKEKYLPILRRSVQADKNGDIVKQLDDFLAKFHKETEFTKDVLDELRSIYQYRWHKIKGTELDYTRSPHMNNQKDKSDDKNFWVVVAQALSGAKLISAGYYQFLMPTIQHNTIYATGEPLEHYPLSHFILSESHERLLSLDACVDYFDQNPTESAFCNRDSWPVKDFTSIEKTRFQFAAKRFSAREDLLARSLNYLSVRRATVNIVYELLTSTLRPGISEGELVFAYLQFCEKLGELDSFERDRLYSQRIAWNGSDYSFYDLLSKISLGDVVAGCITIWSAYLVKFVIDYRPEVYLQADIKCFLIPVMREQSAKKEFRESQADIAKRNEMLMVSLLTYSFDPRWLSNAVLCLSDCTNGCDALLVPFFQEFKTKIAANDKFNGYQEVVSQLVTPRLLQVDKSPLPDDVQMWLKQIRDERYFSKENLCVDPKTLFYVLSTIRLSDNYPSLVKPFLDNLINMFTPQKVNESFFNIRVNVKFKHFLANFSDMQMKQSILDLISHHQEPIQNPVFIKSLYEYLTSQHSLSQPSAKSQPSFFSASASASEFGKRAVDLKKLHSVSDVLSFVRKQKFAFDNENKHQTSSSPSSR